MSGTTATSKMGKFIVLLELVLFIRKGIHNYIIHCSVRRWCVTVWEWGRVTRLDRGVRGGLLRMRGDRSRDGNAVKEQLRLTAKKERSK